ncbi:MAG: FIST C-terminal domain-containing protein [Candidatus Nanohaloarchaea archaeon]
MPEQDRLANDLVFTVLPGFTQARYGREFEFLGEVKKMLDSGFEVVGGSAADHRLEENFQMVNGEVFSDAAVVAHLSTDLEVVTGQDHGMHEEVATGIVTEVEGRELREISGEPAAEFYADAVGASVEDLSAVYDLDLKEKLKAGLRYSRMKLMGEDPVTVHDVVSYSMDNAIATAMGPDSYRILSPYQVTDENGLMMAAEMEESQPVYVMRGDREDIIEAGKNAFPGFDRSSAALAVITDCGTRFTNLEAEELERENELIRERLGEDFVGFYGLGEIGGKGEDICTFMNQTVTGFALKNGS